MNATVAQLTARSLLGRRRALVLLALPAILLLLSVTLRVFAGVGDGATIGLLGGFGLGTIVPLLALIAGTGAIGPEIDDGSVVYLLAKPLRRSTIVTSKLAVSVGVVTAVAAVPMLVAGLVLWGGADRLAVAYGVGALVAGVAYCAVFLLLAVVTRNAVVVGLLYALIWESLIGGFVPGAQVLSIQQWALAVTERLLGAAAQPLGVSSAVSFGAAVALLLAVTVGATLYAGHRLRVLRVTSGET
ncbi:MAG: ABC transporter permease subunit [Egibacteraceae bacterium]